MESTVESCEQRPPHAAARDRVAVILQPSYLPWLGYFEQVHRSDVFVVYDCVQFDKESWRNRNRIKGPGGPQWLTVPVLTSGRQRPSNRDIEIDNSGCWRRKHYRSLQQCYGQSPFFDDYVPLLAALYDRH
ncbi:MAG TPA: WbqC family protein, partial [Vicinamibacterales bacterium]|nr:WbqC family protein [Vicinamibacterales bacterium]